VTTEQFQCTPYGFCSTVLEEGFYDWQGKAISFLESLSGRTKIAVCTPNGAGKSKKIVAPSAIYVAAIFPRGWANITTASSRQLTEQVIPAIERHLPKFPTWKRVASPYYRITTPTGGGISAFTTDDAGRVEGSHAELPDSPLLWIADEAKSVKEEINQGIDRCSYTWKLLTSSPGTMEGFFFEAFKNADLGYHCIRAGLKDCPHIEKSKIEDTIKSYGENHPYTRSTIYGEFMEQDESNRYIVLLSSYERCLDNPPPYKTGNKVLFCDFASGGDENVIAMREGNRVTLEAAWREKDEFANVGRFIHHYKRLELKEDAIFGDASAKRTLDLLGEAGWNIHRRNFGAPSEIKQSYKSWGAQAWLELGTAIEKCEVILPRDEDLKKQVCSRQRVWLRDGRMGIEDKHIMRMERNIPSPDRGDAVAGAWLCGQSDPAFANTLKIPAGFFTLPEFREQSLADEILDDIGAIS
jgi:phage terminase large subunit